jgi:hypothetical protein
MKVKEMIKTDLDALINDLIGKITIPENKLSLSINEILDIAIKEKAFDVNAYVFSEDEETLKEMLVYSMGLSSLWKNYKEENPNATYLDVNKIIIEFMRHMWGLDKIKTPLAGVKTDEL